MPGAKVFVDTNVLLYSHDRQDPQKQTIAGQWLRALAARQVACVNLQVLNELSHALLRKKWFDTPDTVFSIVDEFAELGDRPISWIEVGGARRLHLKTAYSWWDCVMLASAIELGCTHFLSEDLQDGQVIEGSTTMGLTIVDPFAHTPEQILAPL